MPVTLQASAVVPATPRASIVRLALGSLEFPYVAGQAVLVGRPDQEVRRPYSLATAPHEAARDRTLELLVGLRPDGTAGPHLDGVVPGDRIDVIGPVGGFVLPNHIREPHVLFVAGGTGIAPLRAMIHDALDRHPTLELSLLYSARTPDEFAYGAELRALAGAGRIRLLETVTRHPYGDWAGERGRIGAPQIARLLSRRDTLCFVCGPHTLVEDVPRLLRNQGIEPANIRIEEWGG
jgi:ferredoxin-NADP reductase